MEESISIPLSLILTKIYNPGNILKIEINFSKLMYERTDPMNEFRIKWEALRLEIAKDKSLIVQIIDFPDPSSFISVGLKAMTILTVDNDFIDYFIFYSYLLPVYYICMNEQKVEPWDHLRLKKQIINRTVSGEDNSIFKYLEIKLLDHFPLGTFLPHSVAEWRMPGLKLPDMEIGDEYANIFSALMSPANFVNSDANPLHWNIIGM